MVFLYRFVGREQLTSFIGNKVSNTTKLLSWCVVSKSYIFINFWNDIFQKFIDTSTCKRPRLSARDAPFGSAAARANHSCVQRSTWGQCPLILDLSAAKKTRWRIFGGWMDMEYGWMWLPASDGLYRIFWIHTYPEEKKSGGNYLQGWAALLTELVQIEGILQQKLR